MKTLLINNYDCIKIKNSNRSNLRQHEKFWNRKKIRSKKWNFHAVQKFIFQNFKIRIAAVLWIFVEQNWASEIDNQKNFNELNYINDWISRVFATSLFDMIEKIRKYVLVDDLKICENDELRNHILFCQQIETYLLLKHFISTDDIDFFLHAFARAAILFHDTKKHNYQIKILYMFWTISINACSIELKKTILINSLINIRNKKNKFIAANLHLKLFNDYMKKIMRDRRIFFIDIAYLFEYSARFANTVQNQLLWMKQFHEIRVNVKHFTINQKKNIVKLAHELRNEMKIRVDRRMTETNKMKNLFAIDSKKLNESIRKFNRKWKKNEFIQNIETNQIDDFDDDENVDSDMLNLFIDENLNEWALKKKLDDFCWKKHES